MRHPQRSNSAFCAPLRLVNSLRARVPARLPLGDGFRRLEPWAFVVFAAAYTLWIALTYFSSMRQQLLMLSASLAQDPLWQEMRHLGPWSAPLDDVFIHFDFARSTARGYPFQWSEGNGYSTGGTSLLYPFVLAVGYWLGFRKLTLMLWAAMVACVSILGLLLASRRMFSGLPTWTSYLAPPALLAVGALNWSLFSGMEVALFLGLWAGALSAWDDLRSVDDRAEVRTHLLWLGLWCTALSATRPEGATSVMVLSLSAAWLLYRRQGLRPALHGLALAAAPGALVVVGQSVANHLLTGDASAAGAIAKLEMHDPFRDPAQIFADWRFFVRYQVDRITEYHLCDDGYHGWLVWLLALAALVPRATRRYALVLWTSAILWVLVVGLNGQVRWQNERYAMPALAWLLLAASLGVGALLSLPRLGNRWATIPRVVAGVGTLLVVASLFIHQRPRFREQVWFFGRASRNILEQHVRTGLLLRHRLLPPPRRIGLGDAGAIPYVADLPALDLIGLGGFHNFPFARAKRLGLGAVVELLERMPPGDRPDLLALYPSWWDVLPAWFGRPIAEVPVRGNVICGGALKTLYRPQWQAFRRSAQPFGARPPERVVDVVDPADLVSEKDHEYRVDPPRHGHVTMKMLPEPDNASIDLWDAGRSLVAGDSESFKLRGFAANRSARLLLRVAPAQPVNLRIWVNDQELPPLALAPADAWQHVAIEIEAPRVSETIDVRCQAAQGEHSSYHIWGLQAP